MLDLRRSAAQATLLFALLASALSAQYGGPSMLSRGGNSPGSRGRAPANLSWYGGTRAIYESGLLQPQLNEEGELGPVNSLGIQVDGGLFGGHDWRRTSFGVDFRADYRHQPALPALDGSNLALAFMVQHRLSRRVQVTSSVSAGTTNRAFGNFAVPVFGDPSRPGVPVTELFDVRMYYGQADVGVAWRKSARLTLQAGAGLFVIKRKSSNLYNAQGYSGVLGASYRTSSRTALTASYQYVSFRFPRVFSDSKVHGGSLGVQHRLTRSLELNAYAGLFLAEITGIERVRLSPELAEILGRPESTTVFNRRANAPNYTANLSWIQERGRAYIEAQSGVVPGNGVYLTSNRRSIRSGYSYVGLRRLSLGFSTGYATNSSMGLTLPGLSMWQAGGGLNYTVARRVHASAQYDYRTFETGATQARSGSVISFGLTVSQSPFPLPLW
ncbi:MAG TPA: hypothetical protein VES20_18865 [Bryobacteraceae bacterium]|nr:hypothetical protein [Bryobacteraceae bacterium]